MKINDNLLKQTLDRLYDDFDYAARIKNDPIEFGYNYPDKKDKEVVAFVSTSFAHGRVSLFKGVLRGIFAYLGDSPYKFFKNADPASFEGLNTYYRQSNSNDVRAFLYAVCMILKKYGSLEALFDKYYKNTHSDYISALSGFVSEFYSLDLKYFYPDGKLSRGFLQLLPDPAKKSVCKRLHLFLRWMIRKELPDFGLWDYPTSKLLIPVDTHIAKLSIYLGLSSRKTVDIEFAREVSAKLRKYNKEDPVRYDFSLCHIGISQGCPVSPVDKADKKVCHECSLRQICQKYTDRL